MIAAPTGSVATSVISVEEMLTGWYTFLRAASRPHQIEVAYNQLAVTVRFLAAFEIIGFPQSAIHRYEHLKKRKLNVRGKDLRIAAIALEAGAVVVTRNVRDFARVPGLHIEDWAA